MDARDVWKGGGRGGRHAGKGKGERGVAQTKLILSCSGTFCLFIFSLGFFLNLSLCVHACVCVRGGVASEREREKGGSHFNEKAFSGLLSKKALVPKMQHKNFSAATCFLSCTLEITLKGKGCRLITERGCGAMDSEASQREHVAVDSETFMSSALPLKLSTNRSSSW